MSPRPTPESAAAEVVAAVEEYGRIDEQRDAALAELEEAIRAGYEAGLSLRALAELTYPRPNWSHQTIASLMKERDEADDARSRAAAAALKAAAAQMEEAVRTAEAAGLSQRSIAQLSRPKAGQ